MAASNSPNIRQSTLIPTRLDHDLALRLCDNAELDDHERVICTLIALAASADEPVLPETLATFRQILRRNAAS
jgi:hypothetical protein